MTNGETENETTAGKLSRSRFLMTASVAAGGLAIAQSAPARGAIVRTDIASHPPRARRSGDSIQKALPIRK